MISMRTAFLSAAVLAQSACAARSVAPDVATSCDIAASTGYAVAVTAVDATAGDSTLLNEIARSLAYRWVVPSRERQQHTGWGSITDRILPPSPRWADDWMPQNLHRATLALGIGRDGQIREFVVESASGDVLFDSSLPSMAESPMPGSPPLPRRSSGPELLRVRVELGGTPAPGSAHVRFAAAQTRGRLKPGTLRVTAPMPRGSQVTVAYDISDSGRVRANSVRMLNSRDPQVERAIGDALARASFEPATVNCRRIAETVVQTFSF